MNDPRSPAKGRSLRRAASLGGASAMVCTRERRVAGYCSALANMYCALGGRYGKRNDGCRSGHSTAP